MIFLILTISIILFILGIGEKYLHQSRLNQLPIRIHINGTRGKSLLTKMIADLFHQAGYSVCAKITGETPHIFSSKTGRLPWQRRGPAQIKEQLRFIRWAHSQQPDVSVIENMALHPENQYVSESQMIKSNLCIITNFRPDHQEIMGDTKESVAHALSYSFPQKGTIVIPEIEVLPSLENKINSLNSKLITTKLYAHCPLPPFKIHLGLLKKVQELFQISDDAFARTMNFWQTSLIPESFLIPIPHLCQNKYLVNLFACNDITSTCELITNLEQSGTISPPYDIILACRSDRPFRTLSFLQGILPSFQWKRLIVTGTFPTLVVKRILQNYKTSSHTILMHRKINPKVIMSKLSHGASFVLGLGNYVHTGERILSYIHKEIS